MNQTIRLIGQRRSHRAYATEQLSQEQLDTIVRCALQSPSANNAQPWHFSVVQDQGLLTSIHKAAAETAKNMDESKRSVRFHDDAFQVFYHAPTVIFISAPAGHSFAEIDCGIAACQIALAAQSLGLGSVILGLPRLAFMGGQQQDLEKALQFPEGHHFVIAIALGIPTDEKVAHELRPEQVSYLRP